MTARVASYLGQTDVLTRWHRHPLTRLSYADVIQHRSSFFGCKCTDFSKNHKARSRFFLKKIQEPHKTSKITARGNPHHRVRRLPSPHAKTAIAARENFIAARTTPPAASSCLQIHIQTSNLPRPYNRKSIAPLISLRLEGIIRPPQPLHHYYLHTARTHTPILLS